MVPSGYVQESTMLVSINLVHMNCSISEPLGGLVPLGQPQTSWNTDAVVVGMNRGSQKSEGLDA